MTRRRIVSIAAAALFMILVAAPASFASGAYAVRDAAGHKVGSVNGSANGRIWNRAGTYLGWVMGQADGDQVGYFILRAGSDWDPAGTTMPSSSRVFKVNANTSNWSGRAIRVNGKWSLQRRVGGSWHKKGSVSGKCKGQTAGGALRLLLW